jgi:hypothetical protein
MRKTKERHGKKRRAIAGGREHLRRAVKTTLLITVSKVSLGPGDQERCGGAPAPETSAEAEHHQGCAFVSAVADDVPLAVAVDAPLAVAVDASLAVAVDVPLAVAVDVPLAVAVDVPLAAPWVVR